MQRIDSFFKRVPNQKKSDEDSPPAPKKRKARVISSDEEEIPESPQVSTNKKASKKTRVEQKSPQDEPKSSKKTNLSKIKNTPKPELVKIDPSTLFGGETNRVAAKRPPKPKEAAVIELEDDDIDQSLMEIDLNESIRAQDVNSAKKDKKQQQAVDENNHKNGKAKKSATPSPAKRPKLEKVLDINNHKNGKPEKLTPPSPGKQLKLDEMRGINSHKNGTPEKRTPPSPAKKLNFEKINNHKNGTLEKLTPPSPVKRLKLETLVGINSHKNGKPENQTPPSPAKHSNLDISQNADLKPKTTPKAKKAATPRAKKNRDDLDSSVLTDEERHERKRMSAMLYQKYKNRSSCINPGCKEVPKGKPDCLKGLTFLVTGILESLERDEAASIIKEYGGKTMTVVGKKLNYLIAGEEAGPKKLAQAEEFNIPVLSEDDLFDLIRKRSGDKSVKSPDGKDEKPSTSSNGTNSEKSKIKIKREIKDEPAVVSPKKEEFEEKPVIKQEQKLTPNKELNNISPSQEKPKVSEDMLAWVDKYKPTSVKQIIGQQGAASNVAKLTNWLSKWYINHDGKKKLQKPNPWAKSDDGSFFKAALLSGPPGIGKTTTATLVCKELGFDAVEFNASDTRSKRLLKEEVSELLSNKSLYGYFHGNDQAVTKKHVLIMDEVDGMAGNEDRGGIQELIGLIKDSSVPIICMCNDRNHQKMRSLVNYCYDLRFNKPRLEQIKGCIMSICFKEKIKIEPGKLEELIAATNNDIRQSINHISLLSAGKELNLKSDNAKSGEKIAQKDLKMGPWEVVRKVFSAEEHKHMSLNDKSDLFFHDYSLAPLFVQQNYLQVSPLGPKSDVMAKVAATADALSLGDLVDKRIRSNAAWSLLPTQAMFSSVLPGEYMSGHFTGQINFPGWLGKNSKATKRSRLAQEIHDHTRLRTSGSRMSIRLDYAPFLLESIVRPLRDKGMEGVEESLNVIKEYHLLREDIESLIELTTSPGKKGPMDAVDGRVKAALTRAYNKEVMPYTYSVQAPGVKKKERAEAADDVDELMMEDEEGTTGVIVDSADEEENDDLENDGLIKAKKKTTAASSNSSKASGSKSVAGSKKTTAASKPKSSSSAKTKKK